MMYKCCECGHLFEEGEQAIWYENQGECHGRVAMEKFSGCPLCRGGYEEAHQCNGCGEWYTEGALFDGWCVECLKKMCTKENAVKYLSFMKGSLVDFAFTVLFEIDPPKQTNAKFEVVIEEIVKLLATEHELKDYIFEDVCVIENFANWLNKMEVK